MANVEGEVGIYEWETADNEGKISDDQNIKTFHQSFDSVSPMNSPAIHRQEMDSMGYLQDSESCASVSPSPDPDTRQKSFGFNPSVAKEETNDLSAALKTEQEFLDFMMSIQGQTEPVNKDNSDHKPSKMEIVKSTEKKRPEATSAAVTNTRVGLNHLDNLCKMMEQLGDLREQNTRLQRRVQYLEDLRTLQEMHRDLQDSLASQPKSSNLLQFRLSNSELNLDEISEKSLSRPVSEESLTMRPTQGQQGLIKEDQLLGLPDSPGLKRFSSSEDERRMSTDKDPRRVVEKKKGHRSAWGKVKNMISTRKDGIRKKSSVGLPDACEHSKSSPSTIALEVAGAISSDAEDYEIEYEAAISDSLDILAGADACESDRDAGIWIGPSSPSSQVPLGRRRSKPQLRITVPSNENLHISKITSTLRGQSITPPSPRRPSHWTKVKQAFLTSPQSPGPTTSVSGTYSQSKRVTAKSKHPYYPGAILSSAKRSSFTFDGPPMIAGLVEASPPDLELLEGSSEEMEQKPLFKSERKMSTKSSQLTNAPSLSTAFGTKNLADVQKSISGEFTKKIQEWEKLKNQQLIVAQSPGIQPATQAEENLPNEFRKKLLEWEKIKEREKHSSSHHVCGHEDVKTRRHDEEDLPADFKKKLTEWHIRKALAGKSQQNVEELRKRLGEEFNRKMVEWEKLKATQPKTAVPAGTVSADSAPLDTPPLGLLNSGSQLIRKGSGHKVKKIKGAKVDKTIVAKPEGGHKHRDKELQWLEKELHKIEREKQRLEREKEKFVEREARLERMRLAIHKNPADKKEVFIKTSTGEFRFEGINQTFTKKLYEWEERRGIRPESSTIALLDPSYVPTETDASVSNKPKSPESIRIARSKSESSVAEIASASIHSHPSTLSLGDTPGDHSEVLGIQENKSVSEPSRLGDEALLSPPQPSGLLDESEDTFHNAVSYAPAEITRLIDSSGSEEDLMRRQQIDIEEHVEVATDLNRSDSIRNDASYRSLLQENMTLLNCLRKQEDLCRALESQMGDIDTRMDCVADQHFKTLEKLHHHVTILKDGSHGVLLDNNEGEEHRKIVLENQELIDCLRSRIVELELKGDLLMDEKEKLEFALKLHKEHEAEIAESLVERMKELQHVSSAVEMESLQPPLQDGMTGPKKNDEDYEKVTFEVKNSKSSKTAAVNNENEMLASDESSRDSDDASERNKTKRGKKTRKSKEKDKRRNSQKKSLPQKVQKLHNLTADLILQAKRLEQALITKHNILQEETSQGMRLDQSYPELPRHHSLKTRRSLRLANEVKTNFGGKLSNAQSKASAARTWSSNEVLGVSDSSRHQKKFRPGTLSGPQSPEPQDILAMNAELSRMARQLHLEMAHMCDSRDSISTESETSGAKDEVSCDTSVKSLSLIEGKAEADLLASEAREVFQSIAALKSEKTIQRTSISDPICEEENAFSRSEEKEEEASSECVEEDTSAAPFCPNFAEASLLETLVPGGSGKNVLIELLQAHEEKARKRVSGFTNKSSEESRSRSLSPSFESEMFRNPDKDLPEQQDIRTDEDTWNLFGTLKSHDSHSSDCVLSSSFEYEDNIPYPWKLEEATVMETKILSLPLQEKKLNQFDFSQKVSDNIEDKLMRTKNYLLSSEVINDLKARRISDSQVSYEDYQNLDVSSQKFADIFSKSVCDDDALLETKINRNPSIKLSDAKTAFKINLQYDAKGEATVNSDPNIFVPTKRTIFTIHKDAENISCAQATSTYMESQEEENAALCDQNQPTITSKLLLIPVGSGNVKADNIVINNVNNKRESLLTSEMQKLSHFSEFCRYSIKDNLPETYFLFRQASRNQLPVESKKRVLEAANETSPYVRNMIAMYNKRITKNQELLISPFKLWTSDYNENLNNALKEVHSTSECHRVSPNEIPLSAPSVLKSSMASSRIQVFSFDSNAVQELSGEPVQHNVQNPVASNACVSTPSLLTLDNINQSTCRFKNACTVSVPSEHDLTRSVKIKKAKENFLSEIDLKASSKLTKTNEGSIPNSDISSDKECLHLSQVKPTCSKDTSAELQNFTALRHINISIPKSESFRRQSTEVLMHKSDDDNADHNLSSLSFARCVSASFITSPKGVPYPKKAAEPTKPCPYFLRFFRKKDKKEIPVVQKLCRQTLLIDITKESGRGNTENDSNSTAGENSDVITCCDKDSNVCNTLPRKGSSEASNSFSRSCPSSPVARQRCPAASRWLTKGKGMFKVRSKSPCKKNS